MFKAIIFDIGGVVVLKTIEHTIERFADILNVETKTIHELHEKYWKEIAKGTMTTKQFTNIIKDKFGINVDIMSKWEEAYLEGRLVNRELIEVIEKLRKGYKLATVTNVDDATADYNREKGVYSHFDIAILSCEVGVIKPQREIFELALQKLNLTAEECIFIDDREEYVEVARNMEFHTIQFRDNKQVVEDLRLIGIEI